MMKTVLLLFSSSILFFSAFGRKNYPDQEIKKLTSIQYDSILQKGLNQYDTYLDLIDLLDNNLIDSASRYYFEMQQTKISDIQKLYISNKIAFAYWQNSENSPSYKEKAYHWIKLGLVTIQTGGLNTHAFKKIAGDTYSILGQYLDREQSPSDSALYYLEKANNIYKETLIDTDFAIAMNCRNIGDFYMWTRNEYNIAERHFKKVISILDSSGLLNKYPEWKVSEFYRLAETYVFKKDYPAAISYYNKILENLYEIENQDLRDYWEYTCHTGLGGLYSDMGNIDMAQDYFKRELDKNSDLPFLLNELAETYILLKQYKYAKELCEKSIKLLDITLPVNYNNLSRAYKILGDSHFHRGRFKEAQISYNTCIDFLKKLHEGSSHIDISDAYFFLGLSSFNLKENFKALEYFHNSVISGATGYSDLDPNYNPSDIHIANPLDLIDPLYYKAKILREDYINFGNIKSLISSNKCLILCDTLIERSWQSYLVDESKLLLKSKVDSIYNLGVLNSFDLYDLTKELQFVNCGLRFFELNKYRLLLDKVNNYIALKNTDVPKSLIEDYQDLLTRRIGLLNKVNGSDEESEVIKLLSNITLKMDSIRTFIELNFPDYFNIKSRDRILDVNTIMDSMHYFKASLIQYYEGKGSIYVISTNGDSVIFDEITKSKFLQNNLDLYSNTVSQNINDLSKYIQQNYSSLYLYETLLDKYLFQKGNHNNKSIIIIPDGQLSGINFETLITSEFDKNYIDYRNLPYLIKDYCISYAFSSSLFLFNNYPSNDRSKKGILGFAYGKQQKGKIMKSLNWSLKEVTTLKKKYPGRYFMNKRASKENFINHSKDYQITHLALHGQANFTYNDSTRLIFRNSQHKSEEESLFQYELYNLNIGAELVVLTSCETASGKETQGEGVYSMARAFNYAGCPTMVSTLWKLSDHASSSIIDKFYSYLSNGENASQALRRAKLDYINNTNLQQYASPMNWGPLIVQGKIITTQLKTKKPIFHKISIPLIVLTLLLITGSIMRKKSSKKPG